MLGSSSNAPNYQFANLSFYHIITMSKKKSHDLLEQYELQIGADNPILRTVCDEVTEFWPELKQLSKDMQKLMRLHYGTGLAAPQIGVPIRLITTIQWKKKGNKMSEIGETVLVNPVIVQEVDEEILSEESCLSIPDFTGYVDRKKLITVEYQDINGQKKTKEFQGYNATVLQHEIDHLNGILFIDKLSKKTPKGKKK